MGWFPLRPTDPPAREERRQVPKEARGYAEKWRQQTFSGFGYAKLNQAFLRRTLCLSFYTPMLIQCLPCCDTQTKKMKLLLACLFDRVGFPKDWISQSGWLVFVGFLFLASKENVLPFRG